MTLFHGRSTVDEIRERFDHDVDRFSNLETGQSAAIDAPLALELITQAALAVTPQPTRILDLGCGAGNFTLRLLSQCNSVNAVTLIDLSRPMLDRAESRIRDYLQSCHRNGVGKVPAFDVTTRQGDLRDIDFEADTFDIVLAGAVLHHLRTQEQWETTFRRIHNAIAPGGSFWIFDLITHRHPAIQLLMWKRYGAYLTGLKGEEYREHVMEYSTREDSPRSVPEQLVWLKEAGFANVELLHANACFAAFGGIRAVCADG